MAGVYRNYHISHLPVTYILDDIKLREAFAYGLIEVSASSNFYCNNPDIVSDYLAREVEELHRMWWYPVGVIPKGVRLSPLGQKK